jgi:putative peptide zinc metalloprotease protein
VAGTAWATVREDAAAVSDAWRHGSFLDVTAHALQVLAVALPVLAGFMILGRISRRWVSGLATWSRGSSSKRVAAVGLVAVVVTALSWAWAPRPGTYRPIAPGEKGLLTAVLPGAQGDAATQPRSPHRVGALSAEDLPAGASAQRRLTDGSPLQATFQTGRPLPTRSAPQLAMVLVPVGDEGTGSSPTPADAGDLVEPPWVFPFDEPLPPAEGDNQATAYNTTDGTVTYDVAFALVWATGDEVSNVNEAHAYASCSECVTVAVAFQVVLIMDDAHVVVPQNLSVAANYDCYRCITAAIASQLVLSVEQEPGELQLLALAEVWSRLTEFGRNITAYSLMEISDKLDAFKAEIVAILDGAPPVPASTASPSTSTTASPTSSPTASPTGVSPAPAESSPSAPASTTSGAAEGPSGSTSTSPSPSPTESPSASTTSTPTTTTSPSPSP